MKAWNFTTQYGTQKDINKFYQDRASINSGLQHFTVAIPVSVIASMIGMVLVFVIKDRFKALGIVLIVIGIIILIVTSGFGIVGFGMFIATGIVALRYKPKPSMELMK
jgi:glucan phosphoethanolaminetransferase (alkaline phosphatase superfamily)